MQRSLKSRALQLLAQRDQSRLELRAKLLRHAAAEARVRAAEAEAGEGDAGNEGDAGDGGEERDRPAEVEALLGVRIGENIEVAVAVENLHFFDDETHRAIWD